MLNLTYNTDASQVVDSNHDDTNYQHQVPALTSERYNELLAFYHCAMCVLQQLNNTEQHDPMMQYLLTNSAYCAEKIAAWLTSDDEKNQFHNDQILCFY